MLCPACNSEDTRRDGRSVSGYQRYRCKTCGKRFTGNPDGRPPLFDKPLTHAEKKRRYRQKKKREKLAPENS